MGMKVFEQSGMFDPAELGLSYDTEFSVVCVGGGSSGGSGPAQLSTNICAASTGGNSGKIAYWSGKIVSPIAVTVGKGGVATAEVVSKYPSIGSVAPGLPSCFGALVTAKGGSVTDFESMGGRFLGMNIYLYRAASLKSGGGGAGGYVIGRELQFGSGGWCPGTEQTSRFGPTIHGGLSNYPTETSGKYSNWMGDMLDATQESNSVSNPGKGYGAGGGGIGFAYKASVPDALCGGPGNDGVVIVTW